MLGGTTWCVTASVLLNRIHPTPHAIIHCPGSGPSKRGEHNAESRRPETLKATPSTRGVSILEYKQVHTVERTLSQAAG